MRLLLLAASSLALLAAAFRITPCPVGAKDKGKLIGINSVAVRPHAGRHAKALLAFHWPSPLHLPQVDLFEEGEYELARGCFAFVWNVSDAADGEVKEAALTNLLAAQERLLARAADDPDFPTTWRSLTAELERRGMLTIPELDRLTSPFDVYLLFGQLECLEERAGPAQRAFRLALKHDPKVDFGAAAFSVHRVLARIAIGRGLPRDALKDLDAADKLPLEPRGTEAAAALALRLQASAQLVASAAELGGGAARVEAASAASAKVLRKAWAKAEAYTARLLANVGVPAPPPAPAPPVLFLPAEALRPATVAVPPPPRPTPQSQQQKQKQDPLQEVAVDAASGQLLAARTADPSVAAEFAAHGYAILRDVLPAPLLTALALRHAFLFFGNATGMPLPDGAQDAAAAAAAAGALLDAPEIQHDAAQHRRHASDDPLASLVGLHLLPLVSSVVGERLVSTYTFSVAYDDGGVLFAHTDRRQNDLSLSLNLATPPSWPLYIAPKGEGEDAGVPVVLQVNDALLYRGTEHVHFRRPFPLAPGERALQVIFGFRAAHPDHCNSQ